MNSQTSIENYRIMGVVNKSSSAADNKTKRYLLSNKNVHTNGKGGDESSRMRSHWWIFYLVGGISGYFHGYYTHDLFISLRSTFPTNCDCTHECEVSSTWIDDKSNSNSHQNTDIMQQQQEKRYKPLNDDGWNTIDVFYGKVLDDSIDMNNITNVTDDGVLLDNNPPNHPWYSQVRQDEIVMSLLNYKTDGYFVDLAANDATIISNSYAMEKYYSWTGLCIEPNPMYWFNLSFYRPHCHNIAAVVGEKRLEEVYFRFKAGAYGGITGAGFDNGKRWQKESYKLYTIPLLELFQRYDVPKVIDYLSLDVEGAESLVLQNFPLDEYRIKIMSAERLKGPIRQHIKNHGYEMIRKLSRWGETLWIHNSTRDELNFTAYEQLALENFTGKQLPKL